jgi:hypothetical protein
MFNSNFGASVPLVASLDGNNNGMFGGDGLWGLIIILALLGWGGNGFGGFGGFGGGRSCGCEPCATKADLTAQGIVQKLDGITYGITDSTYALNNSIMSGFHGVDNAICTLGYQNQQGFNSLAHQISDCCCETQRSIDGVRYDMATQACDTRHAIQDSTRQILDFLTTDKIASLQAENQSLKLKASQAEQNAYITANQQAQTAELIRRLGADCPVNAYVVQPPTPVTFPTNCCGGVSYANFGYNNGCGCGCA